MHHSIHNHLVAFIEPSLNTEVTQNRIYLQTRWKYRQAKTIVHPFNVSHDL